MLSKRDRYIRSALRKIWRWSVERREALKNAQCLVAGKKAFRCEGCRKPQRPHLVVVDHKRPVVDPERGFVNWDDYIKRMFAPLKDLQVLCKKCHGKKTKEENKCRRKAKLKNALNTSK